jgi:Flp pilus assembly protein TadB
MDPKLLRRAVRQAFPGRNRLATAGDRLEGAVLVIAVTVVLLAVPVAGAVGSELHARQRAQMVSQQETRQRAEAVLAQDAPPPVSVDDRGTVPEKARVRAAWLGPDGQPRQGEVQANRGAKAGAVVPIWIDRHSGVLTGPPLTAGDAVINAVGAGLLLWGAATATAVLLYLLVRFAHTRTRMRRWEQEWRRVSRDWTTR